MKKYFSLMGMVLLLGCLVAPLHAEDELDDAAAAEAAEVEVVSIPDLVAKAKYVTKVKPKKKASVYFFLRSHSRCGFCRTITPRMNELYKEMKNKGAELIMLNCDPDTPTAEKWAKDTSIEIPMVTPETTGPIAAVVPGGGSGGTPNVMAVMADGEQIEGTSGASKCPELVATWKELVKDARKAEADKKKAAKKAKAKKKKAKKAKKAEAEEEDI